jgi:hypothetical protein
MVAADCMPGFVKADLVALWVDGSRMTRAMRSISPVAAVEDAALKRSLLIDAVDVVDVGR